MVIFTENIKIHMILAKEKILECQKSTGKMNSSISNKLLICNADGS